MLFRLRKNMNDMSILILIFILLIIICAIIGLFIAHPLVMSLITASIIIIIVCVIQTQKKIDSENANGKLASKKEEEEKKRKRCEESLQEEEPVFTQSKIPDNDARFPLEKWFNECVKPICTLENELLYKQELLSFFKRKKEAFEYFGNDTATLDEKINLSSAEVHSIKCSLDNIEIQLYDNDIIKYFDPKGVLKDVTSRIAQTGNKIRIKGEVKWFKFNSDYFAALTPFCILLADKNTLYTYFSLYSEISVIQSQPRSLYGNRTLSLEIIDKNGQTIKSDELPLDFGCAELVKFKNKHSEPEMEEVVTEILNCTETPCLNDILSDIKHNKCLEFLEKAEPIVDDKYKIDFIDSNLPLEKPIQTVFRAYVNSLNELTKSMQHMDYLVKRYDAQRYINDEIACSDTDSLINDCNKLIKAQKRRTSSPVLYRKLNISNIKEQNKYHETISYIEKEFSVLIKPIATNKKSEEYFVKGINVPAICFGKHKTLFFFPYFLIFAQQMRQGNECCMLKVVSYKSLSVKEDYKIVRLDFGQPLPKGVDVAESYWEHHNMDGSADMRFKKNRVKYSYYKPFVSFKIDTITETVKYNVNENNNVATSINAYKQLLNTGRAKKVVDKICGSEEIPDLNDIAIELFNPDPGDADDDYSFITDPKETDIKPKKVESVKESNDKKQVYGKQVQQISTKLTLCQMSELFEPSFDTFIAFDIEHTGTFGAANGDTESEITEIGAVKVEHGVITEKFDSLCNPGRKIVPSIARLTHITNEMVADQPPVSEVIKNFKDFVGGCILIGHNIKACDIPHIIRAADRAGVVFNNKYLDTRILANKFKTKQGWENIKLTTLSEYFDVQQSDAHRAWCDAEANAQVYLKLKELNDKEKYGGKKK